MEEKYRAENLWLKVYFNKPFTAVYEKVCKQMVIPFKLTIGGADLARANS